MMSGSAPDPSKRGRWSRRAAFFPGGLLAAIAVTACSELEPLPVPQVDAQTTSGVGGAGGAGSGGVGSTGGAGGTGTGTGGVGGSSFGSYNAEASLVAGGQSIVPTFYRDILPILQTRCQGCHSPGQIAPFNLITLADAQAVVTEMASATLARIMPPWSARSTAECQPRFGWLGDQSLSAAEIELFQVWSTSGARPGNPADAPPPIVPPVDELPAVDLTLQPKVPFVVGGDSDQFRCFVLDPQLAADRFINGSRFLIGNPGIVHHILLVQDELGLSDAKVDADGGYPCFAGPEISSARYVAMWTAGSGSIQFPPGVGMQIKAGTRLVMQVHYHLTGAPAVSDQIGLQLHFTDAAPEYRVMLQGIGNFNTLDPDGDGLQPGPDDSGPPEFLIPAGVVGHTETMKFTVPTGTSADPFPDLQIYALMPHMHFAGSGMKIDIHRPTPPGQEPVDECLIEAPQWRFDWTRSYRYDAALADLPSLRSGDQLSVRCTYDNSTGNAGLMGELTQAGKPGPLDVTLGETALDEMCLGVITLIYKAPVAPP
ncbi:MAG: hypothetical protein ABJE95_13760 [Byssovorax sp.]